MNQNIQDPSKIGTSGLRGLNYSGNNIYNDPSDYFLNYEPPKSRPRVVTTASKEALNKHIERANRNMAETPMVSYGYAEGFGNSQYDDEIKTLSQLENLENFRSQAQSATDQFFNGLGKAVILTGTTFLDGIIGTIWGIGTAAVEGRWSGLWDNGFSKAMNDINEWSEGVMANYYTDAQKESPWYSSENLFSMNFWADKVLKNAGFTAGAILTGVATGNALSATGALKKIGTMAAKWGPNAAARTPGIISAALGSTLSGAAESRMQAIQATDEWEKEQIAELDSKINTALAPLDEEYNKKLQEYNNRLEYDRQEQINAEKGITKIEPYTGEDLSPEQLAKLEKTDPHMYNEIMLARTIKYRTADVIAKELDEIGKKYTQAQSEQAEIRDIMLGKIKEQKMKMGNQDFLTNLVLTTGADAFQYGRFFTGGYKTGRRVVKELSKTQKWGRAIYAGVKNPIAEGSQEMSQDMTDNILGDYHTSVVNDFYNSRYDPDGEQNTANFVNSFTKMFSETLASNESQEAAVIGALTGLVGGVPFRSPIKKGGGFQSPVTLNTGAVGEVREELRKQREAQELIDSFNARKNSGNMKEYYQGLVRHSKYSDDMDEAMSVGDIFNYKNAEHAQLVSDIVMFDKVGRLDELTAMVNGALETTDENLASIVQNTSKEENGKTVGPYIDENGNPKFATEQGKAEMIEELNQKREQILSTIDSYLKSKNKIDAATGYNLTSSQLEELTYMDTQLENWKERAKSMSEKVNTYIDDALKPLRDERDDTNRELEEVDAKLEEGANNDQLLEDGETPFMDTDAGKQLVQHKVELTKLLESNKLAMDSLEELKRLDSDKKSNALSNLGTRVGLIGQLNELYKDGKIDKAELDERVSTITDLGAIGIAKVNYLVKYNEYLNSPEVLSKNTSDAKSRYEKAKVKRATQSIRTALSEYKDFSSFRECVNKLSKDGVKGQTLEGAIAIMANEGNVNAKAYQEYTNTYRDVERQLNKILDEAGATDSQKSDARQMLAIHGNTAQSLDEFLNSNTDMNRYISSIDEQMNANSSTTPSYLVKRAIDEVKNKRKSNAEFKKDKTNGKGAKSEKKSGKNVREDSRNKNKPEEGSIEEFIGGQEEDRKQSNGEEEFNESRRNRSNTTSATSEQTNNTNTQAEQNNTQAEQTDNQNSNQESNNEELDTTSNTNTTNETNSTNTQAEQANTQSETKELTDDQKAELSRILEGKVNKSLKKAIRYLRREVGINNLKRIKDLIKEHIGKRKDLGNNLDARIEFTNEVLFLGTRVLSLSEGEFDRISDHVISTINGVLSKAEESSNTNEVVLNALDELSAQGNMKDSSELIDRLRKTYSDLLNNSEVEQDTKEESQSPVSNKNGSNKPIGGEVSTDDALEELQNYNKKNQDERTEDDKSTSNGGKRTWYRPAIPEVHIDDAKNNDTTPFKDSKHSGGDFSAIYNYLEDKGAFKYVNSGKLKVGDTVYFMVDPTFVDYKGDTGTTIFMVVENGKDNYQVVGSLDSSENSVERFAGLKELETEVFRQYNNKENKEGLFIADNVTVKVSSVIGGNINYTEENRSVKHISESSNTTVPQLAVMTSKGLVAPRVNLSGGSIDMDISYTNKEGDTISREGRVYLLVPNGKGGHIPIPARVKHFNGKEGDFSIDNTSPRGKKIKGAIDNIVKAVRDKGKTLAQEELTDLVMELDNYIYLGNVLFTTFSNNNGQGIKVTILERDSNGNFIYDDNNERVETHKYIYIDNQNGSIKSEDDIRDGIVKALYEANPPIQISANDINSGVYNKELIESDVMTVNANSFDVYNTWFKTTIYTPSSTKPVSPNNTRVSSTNPASPVGGNDTMSSNSNFTGTPVIIDGRKTVVNLDNKKVEKNGNIYKIDDSVGIKSDVFRAYCTALADSSFVDGQNDRNQVNGICILKINGKEYIFNRNSKYVLTGKAAKVARQKIEEYNKTIDQTIAEENKNESGKQTTESHNTPVEEQHGNTDTTTISNKESGAENNQGGSNILESPISINESGDIFKNNKKLLDELLYSTEVETGKVYELNGGSHSVEVLDFSDNSESIWAYIKVTDTKSDTSRYYVIYGSSLEDSYGYVSFDHEVTGEDLNLSYNIASSIFDKDNLEKYDGSETDRVKGAKARLDQYKSKLKSKIKNLESVLGEEYSFEDSYEDSNQTTQKNEDDNQSSNTSSSENTEPSNIKPEENTAGNESKDQTIKPQNAQVEEALKDTTIPEENKKIKREKVIEIDNSKYTVNTENSTVTNEDGTITNIDLDVVDNNSPEYRAYYDVIYDSVAGRDKLQGDLDQFKKDGIYVFNNRVVYSKKDGIITDKGKRDKYLNTVLEEEYYTAGGYVTRTNLPTNRIYRVADASEALTIINEGRMRPANSNEVASSKKVGDAKRAGNKVKPGKVTIRGKSGNPHGVKAFALGMPWVDSGGGTAGTDRNSEVVISIDPDKVSTTVGIGKHANYHAAPFQFIPHGSPIAFEFNSENTVPGTYIEDIKFYRKTDNGDYEEISIEEVRKINSDFEQYLEELRTPDTSDNSSSNTRSVDELDSDDMYFRKVDGATKNNNSTLDKELAWLDKALPQVSKEGRLQVRDGLIQASSSEEAWGAFTGSMVIISDQAANGTVYHEAFHTVFHTALSERDRSSIYDEARTLYGDLTRLELEENMAEDFRVWMQSGAKDTRSFGKKILDYFKSLLSFIGLRPSLMSYYVNINKGKYANKNLNFSDSNTNSLQKEVIQEQREANRKRNEYYSNVKFSNLTAEQRRDLVKGSGWTEESFNRASALEKEVALHCAGI